MRESLKRLLRSRSRISTQLYLGIGAAVILTVIASLVGWVSFDRVGDAQSRVNESSVPLLASAFRVAGRSADLVVAAPRLAAVEDPDDLARIARKVEKDREIFQAELNALTRTGGEGERFERIIERGNELIANIEEIKASVIRRFDLVDLRNTLGLELTWLRRELSNILLPAIDDQLFFVMVGYRSLEDGPAPWEEHFSEEEFALYRYMAELHADAAIGTQALANAFNVPDAALIEPLRERFEAVVRGIRRRLISLGKAPVRAKLAPHFDRLIELAIGQGGGFNLRARELAISDRLRELLSRNGQLAVNLLVETESLVKAARESAREATLASREAILTGRNLLLSLSVVSVVAAVLIAWLFVGRVLSRRLGRLSDRMRRMADGDLEAKVDIGGNDEVAEMAAALEIFRRHALEVQRLNLVEKLADELKGKNDQLESTLGELEKAQDQIVMREKLAALGELTAGVAHEIRNPLNFIKNFSEVSEELMEELQEELRKALEENGSGPNGDGKGEEKNGDDKTEERRELIREIGGDLTDNLKRIREHGERANNIVQSMLMMGRGSGERQATNINSLLSEHARLAYHSARAVDPDFRLTLEEDFDEGVGEYEAIPQDLGRVFLNMVSNACYATDERRRAIESGEKKQEEGAPRYEPTLRLVTRALPDRIEVRVRDNGSGMPAEVIEKIFNPFFTTKPTDQGTGLGLSLSNDIVREHGGSIRVESKPDAFTEMVVELPL